MFHTQTTGPPRIRFSSGSLIRSQWYGQDLICKGVVGILRLALQLHKAFLLTEITVLQERSFLQEQPWEIPPASGRQCLPHMSGRALRHRRCGHRWLGARERQLHTLELAFNLRRTAVQDLGNSPGHHNAVREAFYVSSTKTNLATLVSAFALCLLCSPAGIYTPSPFS